MMAVRSSRQACREKFYFLQSYNGTLLDLRLREATVSEAREYFGTFDE
jgi:hypothetical protein